MPLELGVWRIDKALVTVDSTSLDHEKRLEDILHKDIGIASPIWMLIGRQVPTKYGKFIDLLALDLDGNVIVLELKKDKTPREVVAQLLDYGHWVQSLKYDDLVGIFEAFVSKYHPEKAAESLDEAFCARFGTSEMPETLNEEHKLVVVAASLDDSTERIVNYLEGQGVDINAVFFRCFKDGEREYLTRAWFKDPTGIETDPVAEKKNWNGEYYVSFGENDNRRWEDAMKYGFISGGGGTWYSKTLEMLEPNARVWVNIPGKGYVGVGEVVETVVKADKFKIKRADGSEIPLSAETLTASRMFAHVNDDEKSEYLVRVKWLRTKPVSDAIHEKGMFGNQNTVCKPTAKRWEHTVERLKKRFEI